MRSTLLLVFVPCLVFVVLASCGPQAEPVDPPTAPPAASQPAAPSEPPANAPATAPATTAPAAPSAASGATMLDLFPLSTADTDPKLLQVGGVEAPKPVSWTWQVPSMRFRTLEYAVPGRDGDEAAALVVSFFGIRSDGSRDGGPISMNVDRWAGQYTNADGSPVEYETTSREIGGMNVTLLDLAGHYMGMGFSAPRPGYAQLAAIIEAPTGNVFIRLMGSKDTVEANRAEFDKLVQGLRVAHGG